MPLEYYLRTPFRTSSVIILGIGLSTMCLKIPSILTVDFLAMLWKTIWQFLGDFLWDYIEHFLWKIRNPLVISSTFLVITSENNSAFLLKILLYFLWIFFFSFPGHSQIYKSVTERIYHGFVGREHNGISVNSRKKCLSNFRRNPRRNFQKKELFKKCEKKSMIN